MSEKPKRWTWEEYQNDYFDKAVMWEKEVNSDTTGKNKAYIKTHKTMNVEESFAANEGLIDWLEKKVIQLEYKVTGLKSDFNDLFNLDDLNLKTIAKLEQENLNHRNKFFETTMYIRLKKLIDYQNDALQYYSHELIDKNNPHYGKQRRKDCGT